MKYKTCKENIIEIEIQELQKLFKREVIDKKLPLDFIQKSEEERLFGLVQTFITNKFLEIFSKYKKNFTNLRGMRKSTKSSKSPYDFLLLFEFEKVKMEVYVDFKPINIVKKSSAPFMGSINKYIKRLASGNYYDLYFVIFYKSKKGIKPELIDLKSHFAKDISNFTLYTNWQLQISINKIKIMKNRHPKYFAEDLTKCLFKLKEKGINNIRNKCDLFQNKLNNIVKQSSK